MSSRPLRKLVALASAAVLLMVASPAAATVYRTSVVGGVLYSSGAWQNGYRNVMTNADTQNIGNAYVEMWINGTGLWTTNSPGVFLNPGQKATLCFQIFGCGTPATSIVGKCKSSNTRSAICEVWN